MQTGSDNALPLLMGEDFEHRAKDAGADISLLESHATNASCELGLSPVDDDMTDAARLDLTRRLLKSLHSANHVAEVAFVGEICRAEVVRDPEMYQQIGWTLRALGRHDDLFSLATVQLGPDATAEMRTAQYRLRLFNTMGLTPDDYEREWGPVAPSLDIALADLRTEGARSGNLKNLAKALMVARGETLMSVGELEDRLAWGRAASDYFFFLSRFHNMLRRDRSGEPLSPAVKQIAALAEEAQETYQPADLSAFMARRDEGRSLLVAQTHSGVTVFNREILLRCELPETLVAGNSETSFRPDGLITLGVQGDFRKNFIKLVKIIKRQQRLIRIFPDGRAGDRWETPFLGTTVSFGLGASMLAWHARAAVFTFKSRLSEGRFGMELNEGPLADHDEYDRDGFDEAFYGFYADHLRDIALGPPEDIVGHGGIWNMLIGAFVRQRPERGGVK